MRIFVQIFLFLFPPAMFSQEVKIYGLAESYKGKPISAVLFSNYILQTENVIGTDTVDENGKFSLVFTIPSTEKVIVRTGKQLVFVFAEPGKSYNIAVGPRDSARTVNPDIDQKVPVMFFGLDSTNLNWLVNDFNQKFDEFWALNYQYFILKKGGAKLDSFGEAMADHYRFAGKEWFGQYIRYAIAGMKENIFLSSKILAEENLKGKPVLYRHPEYMAFFNSFYHDYLYLFSQKKEGQLLLRHINSVPSRENLIADLRADANTINDTLRELILIKGLYQVYDRPPFISSNVINLLQQIAGSSRIAEHREISRNIISFLTDRQPGKPAPSFTLADANCKIVSLENFRGKYVYLMFASTWSTDALNEMKLVPEMIKKYGNKIAFITIMTDTDTSAYSKFFREKDKKYTWPFLLANEQVKHDYRVFTVPSNFFIDPNGNYYKVPAENISGGMEKDFFKVAGRKR